MALLFHSQLPAVLFHNRLLGSTEWIFCFFRKQFTESIAVVYANRIIGKRCISLHMHFLSGIGDHGVLQILIRDIGCALYAISNKVDRHKQTETMFAMTIGNTRLNGYHISRPSVSYL